MGSIIYKCHGKMKNCCDVTKKKLRKLAAAISCAEKVIDTALPIHDISNTDNKDVNINNIKVFD